MKKLLLPLLILGNFIGHGQDIVTDAKGKFLFGLPATTIQPKLSSSNVGFETPLAYVRKTSYYVMNSTKVYTMDKAELLFFKFNLINNSKSTLIFDKKTNYSPSAEIGFSWGIDNLINPSQKHGTYFTFAASAFADYQNFKFYDVATKTFSERRTNRISPGIRGNMTLFNKTNFAVSFSGSYQHAIDTDKLTSYSEMSNTFYSDENVSTNGTVGGYLTPVNASEVYRISFSAPLFAVSPASNSRLPFFLMPYYYGIFANKAVPNHNAGIVLSFINSKFHKFDAVATVPPTTFKFEQAFSVGYNIVSSGADSPRYVFVSGTFSLARFNKSASSEKLH